MRLDGSHRAAFTVDEEIARRVPPVRHRLAIDEREVGFGRHDEVSARELERRTGGDGRRGGIRDAVIELVRRQRLPENGEETVVCKKQG